MLVLKKKITIIGAGMVGAAVMMSILHLGLVAEIVLIDSNEEKAKGEALDAFHTTSFSHVPNVRVRAGGYEDCKDSQMIIMTAGPSIKPGEKLDRNILAQNNAKVTRSVMSQITKHTKEALLIFVSNPVDILTYIAQNEFDYPKEKVIGTGTLLDTARFRRIIGQHMLVDTKNVEGYVLGEHGSSAFITWSNCTIGGIPLDQCPNLLEKAPIDKEKVLNEVKASGMEILLAKGYTNYGVAESVARIVKAMVLNELSILPISTTFTGQYGISEVALSIPCVVGQNGIEQVLEIPLSTQEEKWMQDSAKAVKKLLDTI
jgi:L-lactate dehydrogenase